MHSYQWTFGDTALKLAPSWPFVIGYAGMSLLFLAAQWTTEEGGDFPAGRNAVQAGENVAGNRSD